MYLKKVEAIGFKSFANKVDIGFTDGINGIVGPNGCGKSNITDAIKWVLGEQSSKNLRASGMSDVIFAGSEAYKKQNFAQVTLVFDNSDGLLDIEYTQVEITRRLYRNGESEYLLNKTPCRLKDVVDLLLDTGLGKDSLSMISQGAIANFAQAKPIERRAIFEEAAGVAKYKKKKLESLRKLDKTNDNLVRITDIINELENQLEPLRLQANKAKRYLEKKERLEKIEVSVIVHDVNKLEYILAQNKARILDINQELSINEAKLLLDEGKSAQLKENARKFDVELEAIQAQLLKVIDLISSLEKQKNEDDNRFNQDNSLEYINTLKYKLNDYSLELQGLKQNLEEFKQVSSDLRKEYDFNKNEFEANRLKISNKQGLLSKYQSRKEYLDNVNDNKSNIFAGVKAVIAAKSSLNGIKGMVSDLFEVEDTYQEAISKALGAALQNVVVESNNDAKGAISFLKANKAGRATFIPMDTIKPRNINSNDLYIANNTKGFINVATNLVSFADENSIVFEYLLNNTLISDTIDNAIALARLTNNRYRIVSLDGDIISVGGLVTGGKVNNDRGNILGIKKDLEKVNDYIIKVKNELQKDNEDILQLEQVVNDLRNKINQQNISMAKIEQNITNKNYDFDNLKNEYQSLTNEIFQQEEHDGNSLIEQINKAQLTKEQILSNIQSSRESHYQINKDIEATDLKLKETRILISELKDEYNEISISKATKEIELKNALDRLANEYSLTIDTAKEQLVIELDIKLAKEEVIKLKREIKNLGYINLLAIEEYEKVNERYTFLTSQKEDLDKSKDDILNMINDTDRIMVEKFDNTIKDINEKLPDTFKQLFGGGHATLEYSDPTNLLETGIEIIARPPGKSIQNLNLFSGGEKALIALSVLFAILKARPIPLCILDEVEAALDQANVERFAKFLKEFSNETQFIVITHRPGTMEQCDVLYGVTMQEKGVTKMIGVHLDQAKDLASEEA